MSSAAVPAMRTSPIRRRFQRPGDDLEAHAARGLDEHGVAGAQQARARARAAAAASATRCTSPPSRRPCARRSGPTVTSSVDAAVARVRADLGVEALLVGPELEHVAEHGDAASGRGRGEIVECGAHRHRVGVVAVVDDDDPARELDPLAAELD